MTSPVRVGLIGVGGMARYHIRQMLKMQSTTRIVALCEPSEAMALEAAKVFVEAGLPPPPNLPDWQKLIDEYGTQLDAVFIITPHALHHDQTKACLEAGIDVLLEKPMVMTAAEARSLIETRDRTGRLLVVAFQGSLSPQVRFASRLLRANEFGRILSISGTDQQVQVRETANESKAVHVLTVTLNPFEPGQLNRTIRVQTDLKSGGDIEFNAQAQVVP